MKRLFSILLIITAIAYILPVKEVFGHSYDMSAADMDEIKSEKNKRDVYFVTFSEKFMVPTNTPVFLPNQGVENIPALIHTVETPPPNFI